MASQIKPRAFGAPQDALKATTALAQAGVCKVSQLEKAAATTGLPLISIISLLFQFGPAIFTAIEDVVALGGQPGGITLASIETLLEKDGGPTYSAVVAILQALGIDIGTISPPATALAAAR